MKKEILTPEYTEELSSVNRTNHHAEAAFWCMKGVDKATAESLGVLDMVNNVLALLQKVDDITLDISIKINHQ